MVTAEYATKSNQLNQVVIWDQIVERPEDAELRCVSNPQQQLLLRLCWCILRQGRMGRTACIARHRHGDLCMPRRVLRFAIFPSPFTAG